MIKRNAQCDLVFLTTQRTGRGDTAHEDVSPPGLICCLLCPLGRALAELPPISAGPSQTSSCLNLAQINSLMSSTCCDTRHLLLRNEAATSEIIPALCMRRTKFFSQLGLHVVEIPSCISSRTKRTSFLCITTRLNTYTELRPYRHTP
jgi:hypothetical protein